MTLDVSKSIVAKSDQLNSDDLFAGPITVLIRDVTAKDDQTQPQAISIFYDGDQNKPWKPCKSMLRVLTHFWGNDAKQWIGRGLRLYRDDKVMWGGEPVGGIRISAMSHIDRAVSLPLTVSRGSKKAFKVDVLKSAPASRETPPAPPEGKEKPPHVKLAADVVKKIGAFTDPALLQTFMAEDAADDLDAIQKASEQTYAYVCGEYDKKKAELEIPA